MRKTKQKSRRKSKKNTMKPLTPLQNILYMAGGILLLIGAALPLFPLPMWVAVGVYSLGAILFVWMQVLASYEGSSFVVRRLRHQQLIGAAMLIVAAVMMAGEWQRWQYCRHGEWKVALCIGAILQLYVAFRISSELDKKD